MPRDRTTKKDIEKEAKKVLPYLKGEAKHPALLDCAAFSLNMAGHLLKLAQ